MDDKKSELSRRNFLDKLLKAGSLFALGKPLRSFFADFEENRKTNNNTVKTSSIESPLMFQELNEDMPIGPDQLIATKSDSWTLFRNYFRDRLIDDKLQICGRIIDRIAQKDFGVGKRLLLRRIILPDQLELLLTIAGRVPLHFNEIQDPHLRDTLQDLFNHPNVVTQLLDAVFDITKTFDPLEATRSGQKVAFTINHQSSELVHIEGITTSDFDYQYRKQLQRYEPEDLQQNFETRSEIQSVIETAANTFGIPQEILTAIIVIETGGGKTEPGLLLSSSQQQQLIDHDMKNPRIHLVGPAGELGPTQILPENIRKLKFADQLVWHDEAKNDIQNLKTAVALTAAKLYVDALALKDVEQYRYTSVYEQKRISRMSELYTQVTDGLNEAKSVEGLQNLLETRGKLSNTDTDYISLATIYYHGSDKTYPRLGNRSYDQFVRAYYQGSHPMNSIHQQDQISQPSVEKN